MCCRMISSRRAAIPSPGMPCWYVVERARRARETGNRVPAWERCWPVTVTVMPAWRVKCGAGHQASYAGSRAKAVTTVLGPVQVMRA